MKNELINHRCHDCGIIEGQLHETGCDMEICPFCNGQLISCKCVYKKLNISWDIEKSEISDEMEEKWNNILNKKGRIPYIQYPNICAKCGELYSELFMVSDEEWKHYIQSDIRDKVICKSCYNWIKKQINRYNGGSKV